MEQLGGNRAVEARSRQLAHDVLTRARHAEILRLEEYTMGEDPVISTNQMYEIAEREGQKAYDLYMEERQAGKHNDAWSLAPGLTAFVNSSAARRLQERLDAAQPTLARGTVTQLGENLHVVHLPLGAYSDTDSNKLNFYFYPEAQVDEHGLIKNLAGEYTTRDDALIVSRNIDVIRIEGQAGELWQSTRHSPDGTYL